MLMAQFKRIISLLIVEFPFLGYYSIIVGILFGKAFISLGFVFVLLSVVIRIFQKKFRFEFQFLRSSRMFYLYVGCYVLSFFWSSNLIDFKHELISRIIFFILPLIILMDNQLIKSRILTFFHVFVGATFVCSLLNVAFYNVNYELGMDIRKLSHFGSHIRFGICCVLSICLITNRFFQKQKKYQLFFSVVGILWLLYYTFISQVMSSIAMLIVVAFVYLLKFISAKWKGKLKWMLLIAFFTAIVGSVVLFVQFFSESPQEHFPKKLETYTKLGNIYLHDTTVKVFENGNALFINYCPKEMDSVWNLRSSIDVDFMNPNHYSIRSVLMRYLTSKGLTKDAEGVNRLTQKDILAIEKGIPNVNWIRQNGLIKRVNEIKFELSDMNDPNGHSLVQRFEFWRASMKVIKSNVWIGVGVGDMSNAMRQAYNEMHTKLRIENRLGAHNQFLDITVRLGVMGTFIFLCIIGLFVQEQIVNKNLFGLCFISILFTSFLVEDTLNTLTGMSIFSLFFALISKLNLLSTRPINDAKL